MSSNIAPATDLAIARAARLQEISKIAKKLGIPAKALLAYGPHKAKIDLNWIAGRTLRPAAKLILVTAINPTPAGEGKTTTTIGLGDALARIGKRTCIALREPSLGPCFGMKGGATGGGHAQVVPMEDINLHFTGDFHAITAAHNLLAAMIDNHIHWGNALKLDTNRIYWRRAMDMNDRALRTTRVAEGTKSQRADGFDITVASEVMAIFCLAADQQDLVNRLERMVIAENIDGAFVHANALGAVGSMSVLLKEALNPNLVQTIEGTPAFIHGGPFANIAHGCNSVIATRAAMKLADYVVTEAGFGADLGAEKFLDIKCRQAGLSPDAIVVVATVRALKMHGGVAKADLGREDVTALKKGLTNLQRHVENMRGFGVPVVVAINHFTGDSAAEHQAISAACAELGVPVQLCRHWADGAKGAEGLAREITRLVNNGKNNFAPLYPETLSLPEKIRAIAQKIYRAKDVEFSQVALEKLKRFEAAGYGNFSVCMAKTQYSFSADPKLLGAPEGFILPVRDVRLSAGAGFVVALTGDIMTMPGLPRKPAAENIHLDAEGRIEGLF